MCMATLDPLECTAPLKLFLRVFGCKLTATRKSQIAIEFCYKFRDDNPKAHVFWVYASTGARLEQAYQAIAKTLSIPDWNNAKVDAVQLVSDWLADEDNEQWLLVIDNADDTMMFFDSKSEAPRKGSEPPRAFARYIPNNPKGSVLITTRDKRLGERLTNRQKPLEVLPMTRFEARNLLYSKISDDECSDAELSELLSELAYLPLAITQAAAFISENNITVSEYLQALEAGEEDSKELLSEHLEDPRRDLDSENSVMRTWKLSFDQIMKEKPRAAEILSLMAVLDRQGIPKTLLRKEEDTETRFKTAVGTLQAFSLITVEKGKDAAFGMHRLVQLSTQKWLDLEGKTMYWRAQALEVLSNTFPVPTYDVWPTCEVLTPHVRIVLSHQFTTTKDLLRCSKLLNDTSHYARRIGRYAEGYEKSVKALEIRQRILPEDDPLIFESFHMVGMALFTQGEYHAAKEMLQRAKTGRERIFGKEDTDTAESMTSLARVLSEIGDLDGAEELHRQILKIREEDMGTENEYVLETLDHLATLMMNKGKLETAEEMYRRILSGRERLLGMHHPQTLESINNLAGVLHNQGRYNQAEELYMRALEGTERVLGTSHPATTLVHWNMALCQRLKGDLSSAEQSYRRALFGCQNTWGPDNPRTLECMVDLASVLEEKGAHGEAEELVLHASVKFKEGTTAGI